MLCINKNDLETVVKKYNLTPRYDSHTGEIIRYMYTNEVSTEITAIVKLYKSEEWYIPENIENDLLYDMIENNFIYKK